MTHWVPVRPLLSRVRVLLLVFMACLVMSGATAIPLETELRLLAQIAGVDGNAEHGHFAAWLLKVGDTPTADLRRGKRVLQFRLSMVNPPECKCPQAVVQATAIQTVDPNASPKISFVIPDPSQ